MKNSQELLKIYYKFSQEEQERFAPIFTRIMVVLMSDNKFDELGHVPKELLNTIFDDVLQTVLLNDPYGGKYDDIEGFDDW